MASLPKDVRTSVIQETDALIAQQTAALQETATADVAVVAPAATQQQTTTEVIAQDIQTRLTEPQLGGGIRVGRIRSTIEDLSNQAVLQNIQTDQTAQTTIASAAQPVDTSGAVSRQQATQSIQSQTVVSKHREQETGRALQKLQRTCNHKYNKTSRRCIYCSKHRDSHIYDVGNMIL